MMSRFLFDQVLPGAQLRDGTWRKASHHATFTEPMELSSGLANANIATDSDGKPLHDHRTGKVLKLIDNLPELSPGTFGKVKGRLMKATAQSSLKSQRWHHASTAAKAHKHNPGIYQHLPTVKEMEQRQQQAMDEHQRRAIRKLCRRKVKPARAKAAPPPAFDPQGSAEFQLMIRIAAHNGPQTQGARDQPRQSCPELNRRTRRRKQPAVTPEERAAALALLNTPISVPRAQFTAPKRPRRRAPQAAPITTDTLYATLIADAAATSRSAWVPSPVPQ